MNHTTTLSVQQQQIVDTWAIDSKNNISFSDHIFNNTDRIYIQLDKNKLLSPNIIVYQYLKEKNYDIYDYADGIAIDQNKRKIRIGKLLTKLKADETLIKLFVNDKVRNNAKNTDMCICISRNPYDIASMSVNRGWNSCMNMSGGSQARKIENAIKSGTHIAYLIHSNDIDIKRPIARILLNPYHSKNKNTILFPEKLYGIGNMEFIIAINTWCKTTFKLKDLYYKKDENIYNDNNQMFIVSNNPISEKYCLEVTHFIEDY